jgi:hypothetical protein
LRHLFGVDRPASGGWIVDQGDRGLRHGRAPEQSLEIARYTHPRQSHAHHGAIRVA